MSKPDILLPYLPAFHAVMTGGSLSAAARSLKQAQPTVRRHVEALEAHLRVQLFTRGANGLTPTAMAHLLVPQVEAVLGEAQALARLVSAQHDALEGTVRLTASRVVAVHVLPLLLAELRHDAPGIRVEVVATDSTQDLSRRAADIAIRFAPPRQQTLVARRLPDVQVGLFCASGLPVLSHARQLGQAPFIADDAEGLIEPALASLGLPRPENVVLRTDDPAAQIAAIAAGVGHGICQVRLAARLGLHRSLAQTSHPMPAWLVVHEDQSRIARIRHVFDHLKTRLPQVM